jgi:hypothetical protein
MTIYFLFPILACGIWNVVITLFIYEALRRRNYPVSFLWLRVTILKYLGQYRDVTQQETGHTGHLYYQWLVSINLAALCVLVCIIHMLV